MRFLLTIYFLIFSNLLISQQFDFGKVSEQEVIQKNHPIEPQANAAILYKKVNTKLVYEEKWFYIHEVEVRLKIYNVEGFKYATLEIPLYLNKGNNRDIISNIKANTYNYENGQLNKERLKNEGRFEEEIMENLNVYKITFPSVKSGSVIEYAYKIKSPYITTFPEVKFQDAIPYNFVEYETQIPDFFGYNIYQKGYETFDKKQELKVDQIELKHSRKNSSSKALGVPGSTKYLVNYNSVYTTYTAKDVKSFSNESFTNNIDNYTSSIFYELSWEEVPGNNRTNYTQSWEDVAKSIYEDKRFGGELNNTNFLNKKTEALISNENDLLKRIDLILNFVKSTIKWNGRYGVFPKESLEKAYNIQSGNAAAVNLLLTSVLRKAGLNANPVLVSTRSNGITLYPTRAGFNYVICAVQINQKTILLDATEAFSDQNILPDRVLNWYGRLIKGDFTSQEINLMPVHLSRQAINLNVDILENGQIQGKVRNAYTDNLGLNKRKEFHSHGTNDVETYLENKYQNLDITNFKVQNLENTKSPLIKTFDFSSKNSYHQSGGNIYLNPLFFFTEFKNPFKSESRKYPIDFTYPWSTTISVNINIPKNYSIEHIPETSGIALPDNIGMFSMSFLHQGDNIQVRYSFEMKRSILPPEDYLMLKDFYNQLIEKQTENIILKKK